MNKFLQLVGLCQRAGKLVSGESLVLGEIRSKKAYAVIMAVDAASNVDKKMTDKCSTYQIPLIRQGTRCDLGNAIGKGERVVLAITDRGLAKMILGSLKN